MRSLSLVMSECFLIAKFHYTGPTGPDPTKQSLRTLSAKFYYTGPTEPDRTHTDFFCGPSLRETPSGPCGSPTKSVRVRAGAVGPVLWNLALSGRGQGHVSNFGIVDLEIFCHSNSSRRYTDDIHNSTVVGLFMTPIRQSTQLERVTVSAHVYYISAHLNPPTS